MGTFTTDPIIMSSNAPHHHGALRDVERAHERSRARWPLTLAAVVLTLLLLFAVAWSALRWKDKMRPEPASAPISMIAPPTMVA